MTFTDSESFWDMPRNIYYIKDASVEGGYRVGGQYRETLLFTFLTVPKAGHFVPNVNLNNYPGAFAFFSDYVDNQALTCHHDDPTACSPAEGMCTAMNDCWGLGVCGSNGQCICRNNNWKGADCSLMSTRFLNEMIVYKKSSGPKWHSFFYDGSRGSRFI
jgi:hypothetical protein